MNVVRGERYTGRETCFDREWHYSLNKQMFMKINSVDRYFSSDWLITVIWLPMQECPECTGSGRSLPNESGQTISLNQPCSPSASILWLKSKCSSCIWMATRGSTVVQLCCIVLSGLFFSGEISQIVINWECIPIRTVQIKFWCLTYEITRKVWIACSPFLFYFSN